MSRLNRWNDAMEYVNDMERKAEELQRTARIRRDALIKEFGITFEAREPGFACWSHADLVDYYDSPEEVLEALDKKR